MKKKKLKVGDYVRAVRTCGNDSVKGTFQGFYLYDKEDPESIVGVVYVENPDGTGRSYDVYPNSIELWEGRIVELAKSINARHIEALREATIKYRGVSWSMPLADLLVILESLRSSL
jgi:hypothetical protein